MAARNERMRAAEIMRRTIHELSKASTGTKDSYLRRRVQNVTEHLATEVRFLLGN